jgi:hypothetical protein
MYLKWQNKFEQQFCTSLRKEFTEFHIVVTRTSTVICKIKSLNAE